jgi:hypothetical protein
VRGLARHHQMLTALVFPTALLLRAHDKRAILVHAICSLL